MPEAAISDYFYGDEAEQSIYFRIPRQLITDSRFKHLPTDAKLLYGMLLDRMSLSFKNGWYDGGGRVYIYYTVEEICGDMNCGRDKAMKMLADLDTKKGVGLIRRVRQGQRKPTKLYVKRFTTGAMPSQPATLKPPPFTPFSGVDFSGVQKSSSPTPAGRETRRAGVGKTDPNYSHIKLILAILIHLSIPPASGGEQIGNGAIRTESAGQRKY
ncbi:replication initiator protein A [uncultured Oscillibacter sp.]|nr:replication initiator protein A [uncultured Oscillibacter sp.]